MFPGHSCPVSVRWLCFPTMLCVGNKPYLSPSSCVLTQSVSLPRLPWVSSEAKAPTILWTALSVYLSVRSSIKSLKYVYCIVDQTCKFWFLCLSFEQRDRERHTHTSAMTSYRSLRCTTLHELCLCSCVSVCVCVFVWERKKSFLFQKTNVNLNTLNSFVWYCSLQSTLNNSRWKVFWPLLNTLLNLLISNY